MDPFPEPAEPQYLDPAEPQVLVDVQPENFEALSLDNDTSCESSPVLSPTAYSRSKSNLDQVYFTQLAKQERENILPNIEKPQKAPKVQRLNLQRQSSCKEVPEKISKNNAIRHSVSVSDVSKAISSRTSVRKNSFSKSVGLSGIPNLARVRHSDRTNIPVKSVPLSSSTPIVDLYVSPKISPGTPPEEEFVPAMADEAYGLNINDFLPVSLF